MPYAAAEPAGDADSHIIVAIKIGVAKIWWQMRRARWSGMTPLRRSVRQGLTSTGRPVVVVKPALPISIGEARFIKAGLADRGDAQLLAGQVASDRRERLVRPLGYLDPDHDAPSRC